MSPTRCFRATRPRLMSLQHDRLRPLQVRHTSILRASQRIQTARCSEPAKCTSLRELQTRIMSARDVAPASPMFSFPSRAKQTPSSSKHIFRCRGSAPERSTNPIEVLRFKVRNSTATPSSPMLFSARVNHAHALSHYAKNSTQPHVTCVSRHTFQANFCKPRAGFQRSGEPCGATVANVVRCACFHPSKHRTEPPYEK